MLRMPLTVGLPCSQNKRFKREAMLVIYSIWCTVQCKCKTTLGCHDRKYSKVHTLLTNSKFNVHTDRPDS